MRTKYFVFLTICIFSLQVQFLAAQEVKRDLNENIFFVVEAKIKAGQFNNFITVATSMSDVVNQKEPGALNYEWTISQDSSMCYILERYASSEAAMVHMKIFGEEFETKFNEVLEMTRFTMYGNPNNELKGALGGAPNRVLVAGFAR